MIVVGPTSAAVILNNSLSAEISCRAIGLLSISFPRFFFYPPFGVSVSARVCRNNIPLVCMCVCFVCIYLLMCVYLFLHVCGHFVVFLYILYASVGLEIHLSVRVTCVCVHTCYSVRVMGFFEIHTATPMCPAIDLEMTSLLTHTICSANEERQREREGERDQETARERERE